MKIDGIEIEISEEINVHKQIPGKDAEEVIYGSGGHKDQEGEDENRCAICNSRIDEFGYCTCGGNLEAIRDYVNKVELLTTLPPLYLLYVLLYLITILVYANAWVYFRYPFSI